MNKKLCIVSAALVAAPALALAHPGHDHAGLAGGWLHQPSALIIALLAVGIVGGVFASRRIVAQRRIQK